MGESVGEFEQLILFAVVRLEADATAVTIRQEIETRTSRTISSGALYTTLDRLEARGFVQSLPGVQSAAYGLCAPVSGGCNGTRATFPGKPPVAPGQEALLAYTRVSVDTSEPWSSRVSARPTRDSRAGRTRPIATSSRPV